MAILHVRNVPDKIYADIQTLAAERNRSVSAEVITLLQEALRQEQLRRKQAALLADIRRRRYVYPKQKRVPDSVTLLREDRAR
ncbi:MAG TPA: hypothetical protein VFD70_18360 [Anaerolineae bacterium]|nr:hypothetical protein [Anaerolineae bacterium]